MRQEPKRTNKYERSIREEGREERRR